jgi:two-component system sensor histidine kinase YesM
MQGRLYERTCTLLDGALTLTISRRSTVNAWEELGQYSLIFLLLIPIVILLVVMSFGFSQYLVSPIVKCKNALQTIRNNHFGVTVENNYDDEIGELIDGLNEMSTALVVLLKQNENMDTLRRNAEFEMLQQKVNPHFLYNTLESINGLVLGGRYERAMRVCEMLGHIYHYNLARPKWVTLRDELDYTQRYLEIIRHKHEDLILEVDADDEALETASLKMILQPLVENSIRHGFLQKNTDCCLTLSIKRQEDQVVIVVMDNGSGMPPETLQAIEGRLEQARYNILVEEQGHIGIRNVYQRLYLEYDGKLDFQIKAMQHYGTKITICLPARDDAQA